MRIIKIFGLLIVRNGDGTRLVNVLVIMGIDLEFLKISWRNFVFIIIRFRRRRARVIRIKVFI